MNIKDIKNLNKIESFHGNFAIYYNTDGMAGIINRQGEVLSEVAVTKDGECYFINEKQERLNIF